MKTLKKCLLILLSILMIFSFAGCDKSKTNEEETTDADVITTQASKETESLFDYVIPMKPVESEDASEIIETFVLDVEEFKYETTDESKKVPLVYSIYEDKGYDINGKEYNKNAQPVGECPYCEQIKGIGINMCQGRCHISFDSIPSGSIVHPEDATMGPLY